MIRILLDFLPWAGGALVLGGALIVALLMTSK